MIEEIKYLADCPQYVEELASWRSTEWCSYNPLLTYQYTRQSMYDHCNYEKLPIAFVYEKKTNPIGMVCLRECDLETHTKLVPWLGSLYVKPEFRGQGIAPKLINIVEKKALFLGYSSLYLFMYDLRLKDWYRKLGYTYKQDSTYNNNNIIIVSKSLKN